jgi:ESCRT-II complex subunit VPS25
MPVRTDITTIMMSSTTPFEFPREYFFPPFFTRQTNLTTHHAQLVKWSSLILAYCRHNRIFKLSLSGSSSQAAGGVGSSSGGGANVDTAELFHNKKIERRLSVADIREVVDFMRKDGRAEYVGGSGAGAGDVVWVYWRTPEEWAALVEAWVEETAQKGSVLTLYELTESDGTRGTGKC